jgi:hypothetical protein
LTDQGFRDTTVCRVTGKTDTDTISGARYGRVSESLATRLVRRLPSGTPAHAALHEAARAITMLIETFRVEVTTLVTTPGAGHRHPHPAPPRR